MRPVVPLKSTVDRLDKVSSYATGKVIIFKFFYNLLSNFGQKRRRNDHDEADLDREPSPLISDKLRIATTLYVGNLCV